MIFNKDKRKLCTSLSIQALTYRSMIYIAMKYYNITYLISHLLIFMSAQEKKYF